MFPYPLNYQRCLTVNFNRVNAIYYLIAHPTKIAHLTKTTPLLITTNNAATN